MRERKIEKVYIASPLFNPGELETNREIAKVLEANDFKTFLPQRDGILFVEWYKKIAELGIFVDGKAYSQEEAQRKTLQLIYLLDLYQTCEGCDALVFNMNGRVPDEGAVAEAAMAYVNKKPLVIYKNDSRSLVSGQDNPLVIGATNFRTTNKIEDIPLRLRELEKQEIPTYVAMLKIAREIFKNGLPEDLTTALEKIKKLDNLK
jgi:nucleoside 2-deoxyribosyltransferase